VVAGECAAAAIIAAVIAILVFVATHSTALQSAPSRLSPTMSGHYIKTETNPDTGKSSDEDLYFTSCGDGCASVAHTPGGQAMA
jgi:hypothetical protein